MEKIYIGVDFHARQQTICYLKTDAMSNGRDNPKAGELEKGTWAFHKRVYGSDIPYQDFAPQFKAELFDPNHWAEVFANSGAKYVVLTSKHHEGFTFWPSKDASRTWGRPWNSVEIGPKRDLLGDLSEAVRRKGLRMGYYYSLYEWYNPLWLSDKPRYVQEHVFPQFKDPGHAIQACNHLQRRRVGNVFGTLARAGTARMVIQRFARQRRRSHQ